MYKVLLYGISIFESKTFTVAWEYKRLTELRYGKNAVSFSDPDESVQ